MSNPKFAPDECINDGDRENIRRWAEHFGVPDEEIVEAVRKYGPVAKDVDAGLKRERFV